MALSSDGVWRVSNSEISTFKRCRRKWYLGSYRKLTMKNRSSTGALALGSRIHNALEAYYTDGQDLLKAYSALLNEDRITMLAEQRDVTELEAEGELGRIMLEGYLEWLAETGADSEWEVVDAERVVSIPLLDGEVELRGELDMRVRRLVDDVTLFVDHKTAADAGVLKRGAYMNEQFLTYHLLETMDPENQFRSDGGVYNILKKVKRTANARPPFYERVEVRHNKEMLRSFWIRIHGEIGEIMRLKKQLDAGADHRQVAYPTPTKDCSWDCDFYAVCPLFDDGSAAEAMVRDVYTIGNPDERYGEPDPAIAPDTSVAWAEKGETQRAEVQSAGEDNQH